MRLLFEIGAATRSEISEVLGLRKNTVGEICSELLHDGLIEEQTHSQQRNVPLAINPGSGFAVGIEHRPTELMVVMVDAAGHRTHQRRRELVDTNEEARLVQICSEISRTISATGYDASTLRSIGFADFVPHDIGDGLYVRSIWMPHWGSASVRESLHERFGVLPTVARCTDAHCLAEHAYGMARDWDTFMEVQLDEGIGLSVFRNGGCLAGSTGIFGEIGHTIYRPDGEICKCGNRGCLETIAGVSSIERTFSQIQPTVPGERGATLSHIFELAQDGSKTAHLLLKEAAGAIGHTLANVVNVLGVLDIVLYGPLTITRPILESEVADALRTRCLYPLNRSVRLHFSNLDEYASAGGAAWRSLRDWYRDADSLDS